MIGPSRRPRRRRGRRGDRRGAARATDKPTLIVCKTTIGKGSPNRAGTAKAHGEALGADEIRLTREALGWAHEPFVLPDEAYARLGRAGAAAPRPKRAWHERVRRLRARRIPSWPPSTRAACAASCRRDWAQTRGRRGGRRARQGRDRRHAARPASSRSRPSPKALPELLGGSADLTGSNLTNTSSTPALRFDADGAPARDADGQTGRHINYGVREFGMAAVMNGIALHGGFIPYGGTFLTFSDYSRNAIRMAALMKQRVIHVFTHDSIGLGEDGPTHQSIEHAASLRLIPNLDVWRPCDTAETRGRLGRARSRAATRPSALLLSRQNLPYAPKAARCDDDQRKGAYVLAEPAEVGLKQQGRRR